VFKNQISVRSETTNRTRQRPPAQALKNPKNGNQESGAKKMNILPTAQNRVFWVCSGIHGGTADRRDAKRKTEAP